ncbi:hypothetical protein BGZ63DRAFT_446965 [Mariannaea sp. PMI_226]|nr:hypothetical protein BGZ63DRAFT_446965 [Mariannaea sp. PMI_226]
MASDEFATSDEAYNAFMEEKTSSGLPLLNDIVGCMERSWLHEQRCMGQASAAVAPAPAATTTPAPPPRRIVQTIESEDSDAGWEEDAAPGLFAQVSSEASPQPSPELTTGPLVVPVPLRQVSPAPSMDAQRRHDELLQVIRAQAEQNESLRVDMQRQHVELLQVIRAQAEQNESLRVDMQRQHDELLQVIRQQQQQQQELQDQVAQLRTGISEEIRQQQQELRDQSAQLRTDISEDIRQAQQELRDQADEICASVRDTIREELRGTIRDDLAAVRVEEEEEMVVEEEAEEAEEAEKEEESGSPALPPTPSCSPPLPPLSLGQGRYVDASKLPPGITIKLAPGVVPPKIERDLRQYNLHDPIPGPPHLVGGKRVVTDPRFMGSHPGIMRSGRQHLQWISNKSRCVNSWLKRKSEGGDKWEEEEE